LASFRSSILSLLSPPYASQAGADAEMSLICCIPLELDFFVVEMFSKCFSS
jgi:hypothetical protein